MNILIYDNDLNDLEKLSELLNCIPSTVLVDKITDHNDFKKIYIEHDFDIVFIDMNDKYGYELLKFVKDNKPKQRLATINNSLCCCMDEGCDLCKEEFNNIRIIKPIEISDVINVIKGNECKFDCNDELMIKLSIISKSFPFFKLDRENLKFYKKNESFENQVVELSFELRKHGIDFEVYEDHIVILDKKK